MIHTSIDTIPSKLFFKILSSGDVSLLSDDPEADIEELKAVWSIIESEDKALFNSKESTKELGLHKQIESLLAKLQYVILSVFHLRIIKDQDLIKELQSDGYKIAWDDSKIQDENIADEIYHSQLDTIERESDALNMKLSSYQKQLEAIKPKIKDSEDYPFDELVMSYGVVSGWMVRPNDITQSEFRALIKIGDKKMKSLENAVAKNGKR